MLLINVTILCYTVNVSSNMMTDTGMLYRGYLLTYTHTVFPNLT